MTTQVHDQILRSTARLARLAFSAAAASIFLYDQERAMLVFEASSGVGEDRLLGVALPPDRGIAGWVASTGEPVVVREVRDDERFDREFAATTGLLPDIIMAAPIENEHQILGVVEVLDPRLDLVGDMAAIDMLMELANQSSAALSLLIADREARARKADPDGPVMRLATLLNGVDTTQHSAVREIVTALEKLVLR